VQRIFARKFFGQLLPPKNDRVILQMLGTILSNQTTLGTFFPTCVGILQRFSQILPRFTRIFTKSKLLWGAWTSASYTTGSQVPYTPSLRIKKQTHFAH